MLRVTIELIPGGDERLARKIGEACIVNLGTGTETEGNYGVDLHGGTPNGNAGHHWKSALFGNFPRKRMGAWDLLLWALSSAIGDRNWKAMANGTAEHRETELAEECIHGIPGGSSLTCPQCAELSALCDQQIQNNRNKGKPERTH